MKGKLAAAATVAVALGAPAAAQAEWLYTKGGAQKLARQAAETRYGQFGVTYATAVASCRPQGQRYDPRYKYHRWVCGWADTDAAGNMCGGQIVIAGSRGKGGFYHRVQRGMSCE